MIHLLFYLCKVETTRCNKVAPEVERNSSSSLEILELGGMVYK